MTTYATVANTIREWFYDRWKTARSFTDAEMLSRVAWPNKNFTKPAGLSWVRFTMLPATASQETLAEVGSRTFRHRGLVVVQVFTPDNDGDGENNRLCADVVDVFQGTSANGVRYSGPIGESPRVRTIGNDGQGWFQQNVEAAWSADITA